MRCLASPQSFANDIECSKKCASQPKDHLFAYPYIKADGDFSSMYAFFVNIKGEVGGMAASAIKASIPSQFILKASLQNKDNRLQLLGGIDFTGLALYYVLSGSVDIKKDAANKKGNKGNDGSRGVGHQTKLSKKTRYDGHLTLFKAFDDKNGEKDAYYDLEQFFD